MRVLVTGAAGMLGSDMVPSFREVGHTVYATDLLPEEGIDHLDVRDYGEYLRWAERIKSDIVLHLAAETDLEKCERDPRAAYLTNTIGAQNGALIARRLGIKLVYICTAGIFDGEKDDLYTEFDPVTPLSVYGDSKYQGELIVKATLQNHFVFRPGWMIGGGPKDKKFVGKILKQIRDGTRDLHAVNDKYGTPTYTRDFSRNVTRLIQTEFYGTYHMVCRGSASRYDVACEIVKVLNRNDIRIHMVQSDYFASEYPVARPRSECLTNFMLDLRDMNMMRNWRDILPEYIRRHFPDMIRQETE